VEKAIKTHARDIVILPEMIDLTFHAYDKEFIFIEIKPGMLGHRLGELVLTCKQVKHGRAEATGSSMYVPLK